MWNDKNGTTVQQPEKENPDSSLVEPVGYDLCPGERWLALRGVHHPVPVGLANHETDLAHLELLALLLDVGPANLRNINPSYISLILLCIKRKCLVTFFSLGSFLTLFLPSFVFLFLLISSQSWMESWEEAEAEGRWETPSSWAGKTSKGKSRKWS